MNATKMLSARIEIGKAQKLKNIIDLHRGVSIQDFLNFCVDAFLSNKITIKNSEFILVQDARKN